MKPKKRLSALAVQRIRKMIERVKADPANYDQNRYSYSAKLSCGTPFCAVGHLLAVCPSIQKKHTLADLGYREWLDIGRQCLGTNDIDIYTLFSSSGEWPEEFAQMYYAANGYKTEKAQMRGRVRAFEARWNRFIETDGAE